MITLNAPSHSIKGAISISGSKSLSNRLLLLDQILGLRSSFQHLSDSEDTRLLVDALAIIRSKNKAVIDVHHAGTAMRFLCAYLAINKGDWVLTGSERMKQRPMAELVTALQQLGAEIHYLENVGFPPLSIKGKPLDGGSVHMDGSISSQFLSALLLIAPSFKNGLSLQLTGKLVSTPYLQMTIELLKRSGVHVNATPDQLLVKGKETKPAIPEFHIESDWSSASYFYSICAFSENANITLSTFDRKSLQGDSVLPVIFEDLGVKTVFKGHQIHLTRQKRRVSKFEYDCTNCPDLAQTIAVTCFGLGMEGRLTGLKTLKIKETDRISALKKELEKFGVVVEAGPDFLHIHSHIQNAKAETIFIDTHNDHRMALSFAPLSLILGSINIHHPEVVNKSYPAFWHDLISLGFSVNLQP